MGRPPLGKGLVKNKVVLVRLTPAQHKAMSKVARQAGLPLATWMRNAAAELLKKDE